MPRRKNDQYSPLPSPRLHSLEVGTNRTKKITETNLLQFSSTPPSGLGSKRRAGKFNFKELDNNTEEPKQPEISEMEVDPTLNQSPNGSTQKQNLILLARSFDLHNPLAFVTTNLRKQANKANRTQELEDMSVAEKVEEKAEVKLQLRAFDHAFRSKHGRMVNIWFHGKSC